MSEIYTIVCENVSVTAVQDILTAYCGPASKLQLLGIELAANGQTTVGNYPIRIKNLTAAVVAGSGGGVVAAHNINDIGSAPSFTARRNDTTQATGSGSSYDLVAAQFNPINGYYWTPPGPSGDEPKCTIAGAFVLSLDSVTGTLNISATMWLGEQ
jgi:hypothetical protein